MAGISQYPEMTVLPSQICFQGFPCENDTKKKKNTDMSERVADAVLVFRIYPCPTGEGCPPLTWSNSIPTSGLV